MLSRNVQERNEGKFYLFEAIDIDSVVGRSCGKSFDFFKNIEMLRECVFVLILGVEY